MARTLLALRTAVQEKLNNVGSGDGVIFQPSEIDGRINDAILHVGYQGELALIQNSLFKVATITPSAGIVAKPSDYFRFSYARVDSVKTNYLQNQTVYDWMSEVDGLEAGEKNKYLVERSGADFRVYPTTAQSVELGYVGVLTELTVDGSVSPLTATGDSYASDWAFALLCQAKNFRPELAGPIFNRINAILLQGKATGSGGRSTTPGQAPNQT